MNGMSRESTMALIEGRPDELLGVVVQHRPYAWTTFRGVRLQPRGEEVAPAPFGPFRIGDHSVRLVGVTEASAPPYRAWSPDGGPITDAEYVKPPPLPLPNRGSLRFAFALNIQGPTLVEPSVRVAVARNARTDWGPPPAPVDRESPAAIGRILWPTVTFPADGHPAAVEAELMLGPWRTDADTRPGSGMERIEVRAVETHRAPGNPPQVEYATRWKGSPSALENRRFDLAAYDAKGERLVRIDTPTIRPDLTYPVIVSHPERVVRWVLRSREAVRVRFEGVHLRPNP